MKTIKSKANFIVALSVIFIVDVPSLSQANSTIHRLVKTGNNASADNKSPVLVSQLVSPVYACTVRVDQPDSAPPTARYFGSLSCNLGTPGGFALRVHNSNVNFPTTLRFIGNNNHYCSFTSSTCITPTYSRTIDRTQHLWIYTGVSIIGSNGTVYTRTDISPSVRPYNNRGVGYPFIKPTRGDMPVVPFPYDPPYVASVPRAPNFASELTKIYNSKNWAIPTELPQAHHIKPIAWGGGNDPSTNGVYLGSTTHRLFTNWWGNFSNLNW